MVYSFFIISSEKESFLRQIDIDSHATFLDLNDAILKAVNYSSDQLTEFYLTNKAWKEQHTIILDNFSEQPDTDFLLMKNCVLKTWIKEKGQRLMFLFDPIARRMFHIELTQIKEGRLNIPELIRQKDKAPKQFDLDLIEPIDTDDLYGLGSEDDYGSDNRDIYDSEDIVSLEDMDFEDY